MASTLLLAKQRADYRFRPMVSSDLAMVRTWLSEPHVRQWWGEPDEQFALVSGDLADSAMEQFIVAYGERPFAYVQSYDLSAWPPEIAFSDQPRGTHGVDQFIGEPAMIDRGHGSAFLRIFVSGLLDGGAPRVLTDPDPANHHAIRAYEKAGFLGVRLVDTSEGRALLMIRDNPEPPTAP
ncbi:MAG: GNAT family N-acetyltransferase [Hyphomicrobiaceae bacterium]